MKIRNSFVSNSSSSSYLLIIEDKNINHTEKSLDVIKRCYGQEYIDYRDGKLDILEELKHNEYIADIITVDRDAWESIDELFYTMKPYCDVDNIRLIDGEH